MWQFNKENSDTCQHFAPKHTHTHTQWQTRANTLSSSAVHLSLPFSHYIRLYSVFTLGSDDISFVATERIKVLQTRLQTMTVSFLVPAEFMCDCSTSWSRPIYSRLLPPPPCSLKVTPGDFGRGVLELLCQCEALRWQVCRWGWSLWSRTAPSPTLKHKATSFKHTERKCIHISVCMHARACVRKHKHSCTNHVHT